MDLKVVGEGATTKVYRDGDKAIKLYPDGASLEQIEAERKRQMLARQIGLCVPEVYEITRFADGTIGLEMQYIAGEPLMQANMSLKEVRHALLTLVELQRDIHQQSGDGFPHQSEAIKWKIDRNSYIEEETKAQLFDLLETLMGEANILCHGDFHPLNVLKEDATYWVIDWVDATSGNPKADVCRTYLILKQFAPELADGYLTLFCQQAGFVQEEILIWLPIIAAARMTEGVDEVAGKMMMGIINEWQQSR